LIQAYVGEGWRGQRFVTQIIMIHTIFLAYRRFRFWFFFACIIYLFIQKMIRLVGIR
jgi:hypothetical protein